MKNKNNSDYKPNARIPIKRSALQIGMRVYTNAWSNTVFEFVGRSLTSNGVYVKLIEGDTSFIPYAGGQINLQGCYGFGGEDTNGDFYLVV